MYRNISGRRALSAIATFGFLLTAMPVIAAENSGATHSADHCGTQLQQIRADIAKQPAADPNIRAQVNEASVHCQQGEPEEAQKILDQVARDMREKPTTRTN